MKVDVLGLMVAAQKLMAAAQSLQAITPPVLAPLAPDATSFGAAGRLDVASTALWSSTSAQVMSLNTAASHLVMVAARFGTQEELNRANLTALSVSLTGVDAGALSTLAPVPPLAPDARPPLPPLTNLSGEVFSQLVTAGSSAAAVTFGTTATNAAVTVQTAALTLRQVAASVPELWDSPVGTAALSGRINEHAGALVAIADQWSDLGDQARKHGQEYGDTVTVVPKPREFEENEAALRDAQANNTHGRNNALISQLIRQRGELEQRAIATAQRYHAETEGTTAPAGTAAPEPTPGAGAPYGAAPSGPGGAAPVGARAGAPGQAPLARAGAEAASPAGQAGDAAGQLASLLPSALGAIGGLAGSAAGMAGQVPQALMQTGQGLAQTATQGLSGLAGKKPTDAELAKYGAGLNPDELSKAKAGGGAGGGGGTGDTHPAGALGPPVTPSTSHTPPTLPAGAPAPPGPTPARGSAMGGMPMGMPMGMMPHGGQGDGAGEKVPADRKVVMPPQPHTETVTGKVSDRTAAAAEASRTRAESDDPDDEPPRGRVMRRITLAPLQDDRP